MEKDKQNYLVIEKTMLKDIAEAILADWVHEDLQGDTLEGEALLPEAKTFFADPKNKEEFILSYYFDGAPAGIIFDRLARIIEVSGRHKFTAGPLEALGFSPEEIEELTETLIETGSLDEARKIPEAEIGFFLNPDNAALFNIEAFEDYNKDVFFMLNEVAGQVTETREAIETALTGIAETQEALLLEQLQGIFGLEAAVIKSVSRAVFGEKDDIISAWLLPVFETVNALDILDTEPENFAFNTAFKRIMQFSALAKKLELTQEEVEIAFRDQSLAAKFPEKLALPEGLESFDALLEYGDFVYLFKDARYWIYRAKDYKMVDKSDLTGEDDEIIKIQDKDEALRKKLQEDPVRKLYKNYSGITVVDAAFEDRRGNLCVVSGDHYYIKMKGNDAWDKRRNEFGCIKNDFDGITAVDAAYKDTEGRVFLFANDHYVRYSDSYDFVDEGYPKTIAESWKAENQDIELPEAFQREPDAAFEGADGKTYFFKGNEYISSDDTQNPKPVSEFWGRTEHHFMGANGIDAAFNT
ncbi:MAG: hypothetical protein KDD04_07080, partial [Sinomicrobium sp.]|nr:hypothetical protein [Sinomicrobium sp.]